MKKLIYITISILLIIALTTGCTKDSTKPTSTTQPIVLKDGTYSVVGQADQLGWTPEIAVTILNGKFTEVKYDESIAMKKSENIEYQKNWKAQSKTDLLTVYGTLQNNLIKTQDITKVDTVTGATKASENFRALTADALKTAKVENQFKDGTYSAAGVKDEKSWTPTIEITIKGGKISAVKYDEISSKVFRYKSHDKAYIAKFKEKSKLDLTAVYAAYQKSLLEKQDAAKIDKITGATQTYHSFLDVMSQVIEQAK